MTLIFSHLYLIFTAGLDLTWIALLGGMLAIPYYFWSDDAEKTPSTSRKDDISPPLPSLMPPQYPPGIGLNNRGEESGPKRRGRRPGGNRNGRPQQFPQGGMRRNNKFPNGQNAKGTNDKNYRNWYNNYYFQQFKQHPPSVLNSEGILSPALGLPTNNIQAPIHPLAQASGIMNNNLQNNFPPNFQRNNFPVAFNTDFIDTSPGKQAPVDRNFNSVPSSSSFVNGLVPPPESVNDPNRIDTDATQERVESSEQQDSVPEETVIPPVISEKRPNLPNQVKSLVQQPNALQTSENEQKKIEKDIFPGFLEVPGLRNENNLYLNNNQIPFNVGAQILNHPAPFRPTHIQNHGGLTLPTSVQHEILGLNPPHIGHPIAGHPLQVSSVPTLSPLNFSPGVQWLPYNSLGPLNSRPILRGAQPLRGQQRFHRHGMPNAISNLNGIRGVPNGLQNSPLTTPMLPPPLLEEQQIGSGEQRETFGSFRPGREGSSHFKVSFGDDATSQDPESGNINDGSVGDNIPNETNFAKTVVFVHPNNAKNDRQKGINLDLSQNAWRSQSQESVQHNGQESQPTANEEKLIHESKETQTNEEKIQKQLQQLQNNRQEQIDQQQILRRQQEQQIRAQQEYQIRIQQDQMSSAQQHQILQQKQELERQHQLKLQKQKQQQLQESDDQQIGDPRPLSPFYQTEGGFNPEIQETQSQKQELQRQHQLKLQKQKQQLLHGENQQTFDPRPLSPFYHSDEGFVPIHGPPKTPSLLKPTTEKYEIPKPSAFLDKLLAEQSEKKTSFEITYGKPIKLNKKKEVIKEKIPQPKCKYYPQRLSKKLNIIYALKSYDEFDVYHKISEMFLFSCYS